MSKRKKNFWVTKGFITMQKISNLLKIIFVVKRNTIQDKPSQFNDIVKNSERIRTSSILLPHHTVQIRFVCLRTHDSRLTYVSPSQINAIVLLTMNVY